MDRFRWLLWICGVVLIINFAILMAYGNTLRSTHLFIVRGTIFYPAAYLNLILGILLVVLLVWDIVRKRR
jgi:hypothetical protein